VRRAAAPAGVVEPEAAARPSPPAQPVQDLTPAVPSRPAERRRPPRLQALDAARGFAIVVMLVVMNPGNTVDLPAQLHHPPWHGFTFADTALPLFLFASGFAMTLSSRAPDARNVLRRVGLLVLLGIALGTLKHDTLTWTGVLQHLAGSYLLAWAVLRLPRRAQVPVAVGIVAGLWLAFVAWRVGGDPWADGDTLAHAVDRFLWDGFTTEGTLQTIAGAGTVVAGACFGRLTRRARSPEELLRPLAAGAAGFVGAGLLLATVVPLNKHLWTPSFAVLTVGTSLGVLALFVWLIDVRGLRRPTRPLVHLGANPIVVYALSMAILFGLRNFAPGLVPELDPAGSPLLGAALCAVAWTTLWWIVARALYRRRVLIRL
jgi:predicted acyltransferase